MSLRNYDDDALRKELDRRADARAKRPKPLDKPDWANLVRMFEEHNAKLAKGEREDEDYAHWVYETAAITIYGPRYFDWANEQTR